MRITGMATGMDTDTMIKDMLKPQQLKIDSMKQQQQIVLWQQEIYRDIIKDVHGLMGKYFDVLNKDTYLLSSGSLNSSKVKCSNEILNITASSDAKEGTYKVNVKNLAEGAKIQGEKTDINLDTKLSDINNFFEPDTEKSTFNISINGEIHEINIDNTMTVKDLSKKVSESTNGKVNLEYSSISKKFTLSTKETGKEVSLGLDDNGIDLMGKLGLNTSELTGTTIESIESNKSLGLLDQTLTIKFDDNGEEKEVDIRVNDKTTLDNLSTDIYKQTGGKVKLNSEIESGKVKLTLEGGTEITGNFPNVENAAKDLVRSVTLKQTKGKDLEAKITLPGDSTEYDITSNNNKFSKDGINFDLNGAEVGEDFTITITKDNGKAIETVKSFIEDYNKLIDKVNKLNTEKRNYSYKPLTDDEKKDMKEEEIKKWEEQAKKGILKGDSYLKNMMSELRMDMFGDKDTLFSIGIETSDNVREGGKLVLDEDKFKKALNEDSEKTFNTFKIGMEKVDTTFKKYASTRILGDTGNRGLLLEKAGIEGSVTDKNNILTKSILDKEDMIKEQVKKMNEMENRYYLQFAQLEKAMNSLNSQMNWFTQQMGS
ncbi:flagellar filament capping protein FliD [Clostridium senegalense]|uniref:flagellar filament capping protein FliD n=1 Tax=Clostridium senegalense TaxID=1465809 RepID=UPI000288C2F2|nr:flagellar filament capping protein FliD [Clostridium senegalense]